METNFAPADIPLTRVERRLLLAVYRVIKRPGRDFTFSTGELFWPMRHTFVASAFWRRPGGELRSTIFQYGRFFAANQSVERALGHLASAGLLSYQQNAGSGFTFAITITAAGAATARRSRWFWDRWDTRYRAMRGGLWLAIVVTLIGVMGAWFIRPAATALALRWTPRILQSHQRASPRHSPGHEELQPKAD